MNQSISKLRSIKPIEKLADDPIDPPSPRSFEIKCVNCHEFISATDIEKHLLDCKMTNGTEEICSVEKIEKLIAAIDKYLKESNNTRDLMHATSLKIYAKKLKD